MEPNASVLLFVWGWFKIIMFCSGCCNLAAMWLPTNHKKGVVQGALDIVNIGAGNFNKAENKDETRP